MKFEKEKQLPDGWINTKLRNVVENIKKINPRNTPNKLFYYCDINSIDNSKFRITAPKQFLGKDAPSRARQPIRSNDILFSTVRTYLKNIATVPSYLDGHLASTGFCVLRPKQGITNAYIFNYVQSEKFLLSLNSKQRGTSYPAVRDSDVLDSRIVLPPFPEQYRIVSKIESIFAQIDAYKTRLMELQDKIRSGSASLSSLKSSVLKQAFEGKLVPQDPNDEPVENLLERICKNNSKITFEKKNCPTKWIRISLEFITENFDSQRIPISKSQREKIQGNIPYYGASGIIDYINKSIFHGNFVLIGEDGANLLARTTPIAFIACGDFWVNNHAHVLKPLGNIPLKFLTNYINSINLSPWITGTAQPKLNQAKLNQIPILLPPLKEQHRIVSKIESIFAKIDTKQKEIEKTELYIRSIPASFNELKKSILKLAFEGKLVPQDPNDEPVSVFLER